MIADAMIDTNILVYAASRSVEDGEKAAVARQILLRPSIGLSAQVLQEFLIVTTRKVKKPWSMTEALDWLSPLEDYPCIAIDSSLVRFGAEISMTYKTSYWDGAILAAAHRLKAKTLYTEDLNHHQVYGSVQVINPFLVH